MRVKKRTIGAREEDLIEIAEMWSRGLSLRKIAQLLSSKRNYTLCHQQIDKDVHLLLSRWREKQMTPIEAQRAEELIKINALEKTYWDAWERSLETKTRTLQEVTKEGKGERKKGSKTEEQTTGNPSFLAGIQWCINKRCELLGLDAPKKQEFGETGAVPVIIREVTKRRTEDV